MTTYGVVVIIEGTTYSYHIPSEEGVRELFASITAPIDDFIIYEQKGADIAELTYSQVARLLEPNYVAA